MEITNNECPECFQKMANGLSDLKFIDTEEVDFEIGSNWSYFYLSLLW